MIEVKDLGKIYKTKNGDFDALRNFNLTFEPGEFISILGESGSGKSTFLNLISGIDNYTSGEIIIDGMSTKKYNDLDWRKTRNQKIGFIFQRFNLIEHLSVIENVTLPLILTGADKYIAEEMAVKLLEEVGLGDIINKATSVLSGGQKQRIAIARTMIINPTVILADEPTGALDSSSGIAVMQLLQKFAKDRIIIMVTHDEKLAAENSTRVIRIHDGEIQSDLKRPDMTPPENAMTDQESLRLIGHEYTVSEANVKYLKKKFPSRSDEIIIGEPFFAELTRTYHKSGYKFTRMIAKKNYKQKAKTNNKILWSFVISLALLLTINLVLRNIITYNLNKFDINNDYERYLVENYMEDGAYQTQASGLRGCNYHTLTSIGTGYGDNACDLITELNSNSEIDEAGMYFTTYDISSIYHMYDMGESPIEMSLVDTINPVTPRLVSLPKNEHNFNLKDEIYIGNFPNANNEFTDESGLKFTAPLDKQILVSSEFLFSRFYGYSLDADVNKEREVLLADTNIDLDKIVGTKLYLCAESYAVDEKPTSEANLIGNTKDEKCEDYFISGIINSYYEGVSYTGNIYSTQVGFTTFLDKMKFMSLEKLENYYTENVYYYYKDFKQGENVIKPVEGSPDVVNMETLLQSTVADVTVENGYLSEYNQILLLDQVSEFVFYMIYIALIVICGTVNISMVNSSVTARIKEIGVYSSIGVSKTNIRNIFMFEAIRLASRIAVYTIIFNLILLGVFYVSYNTLVTRIPNLDTTFGTAVNIDFQLLFSGGVIGFSVIFLLINVLIPSFRAANLRAIEALRG